MDITQNSSFVNETFAPWLFVIPENQRIAVYVSYSVVLLLSVVANAYIIAVVLRNKEMHSSVNYLIVNMASSDLVASIFAGIPLALSRFYTLSMEWRVTGTLGNILCKFHPFIQDVSIAVSILSNVAIGFDRFFAVVFPMKLTPRFLKTRITLPAIWLIATATFAIDLFNYQLISYFGTNMCIKTWPTSFDPIQASNIFLLTFVICYFVVPFIIIALLYVAIGCSIKRQKLTGQQSVDFEKRRRKENTDIIKMLFTIVACFFICWFPFYILNFLELFVWKGAIPTTIAPFYGLVFNYIYLVACVSFITNPFICFIFSRHYRKYLRKTFPFSLFC